MDHSPPAPPILRKKELPARFVQRLEGVVGARHVTSDHDAMAPFSHDETPNLPHAFPDVVVHPESSAEVAEIVALCRDGGVYLTPRGAGTGQSGGCVPVYGGVVLATDRMSRILTIDDENLIAEVEPGVVLADFQAAVEERGLFYPPDPASLKWCTLGGNVAENAGGPRALRYGVTREYVLGTEAVLPTGEGIRTGKRTVKGVAGYDLTALLCGSEGTLAVMTKLVLKLIPKPRHVTTALSVFDSANDAASAVAAILKAGIIPRTLEYMDKTSIEAVRNHGAPYRFQDGAAAALIIETDGDDEGACFSALERALDEASACGASAALLATDERQRRDIWDTRRLLSEATRKIRKRKMSEDVVVPRSKIPEMVAYIGTLGEKHGLGTCAFGHAGDGNLHVQVLFNEESELVRVEAVIDDLFRRTIDMGGTITGEHGVGLAKMKYLPLEQGPVMIDLQRRLKAAFDPAGILNPGKFL